MHFVDGGVGGGLVGLERKERQLQSRRNIITMAHAQSEKRVTIYDTFVETNCNDTLLLPRWAQVVEFGEWKEEEQDEEGESRLSHSVHSARAGQQSQRHTIRATDRAEQKFLS